jgi:hypothetical protein
MFLELHALLLCRLWLSYGVQPVDKGKVVRTVRSALAAITAG